MKQVTWELNLSEVHILAEGVEKLLREDPRRRSDQWNRQLLELGLRFEGAKGCVPWVEIDVIKAARWAVPYLRKALADASETSTLRLDVKALQAQLKAAKKPAPKPKPRFPKRKARSMKLAAAAGGDQTGVVGPFVNDPLPAAAVAKAAGS